MSPKLKIAIENLLISDSAFNEVLGEDEQDDALQALLENIGEVRDLYEKELGPIKVAEDYVEPEDLPEV